MEFALKGFESLKEEEKAEVNRILEASYEKIKRKTRTDFILKVVLKVYSKPGEDGKDKRKKYSVQASISGSVRSFDASADDWDLNKTLHKVLIKLENEVEHAFHASEQRS